MIIKTDFSVAIESFQSETATSQNSSSEGVAAEQPAWWTELANLPEDYESLLIIERELIGNKLDEQTQNE